MSKNHLTVAFPLESPADAKALPETLASMVPEFLKAADAIGTVHYSRFTVLSDKTFLFLADFDGEFGQLIGDLASHAGTMFDTRFEHVPDPPPTPVSNHTDAFAEWAADHLLSPAYVYSAYPGFTVKEIKDMAAAAGVEGSGLIHGILTLEEGGGLLVLQPPTRFSAIYKDLTDRDRQQFGFVVGHPRGGDFWVDPDEVERTLDLYARQ